MAGKKESAGKSKNLPPLLYDSYKRYKDDTQRLIAWLVKVAKNCGYPSTDIKTCNELRALAKHVSTHATSTIPASILAVGQRAISLRKMVTKAFLSRGSSKSRKHDLNNKKHAYFVEVLEEILGMFQSHPADDKPVQDSADAKSWLNRFAALTVEETNEISDIDEGASHSQAVEIANVLDEEDDEEDVLSRGFFRLLCLFYDLQQWRSFIADTWTGYAKSEVDLTSAAVVTDQALKFGRQLIEETTKLLPEAFLHEDIDLQTLMLARAAGSNLPPSTHLGLPFNVQIADVIDYCFLTSGIFLNSFVPVIKDGTVPSYNPGFFGVYNPKADRAKMSVAEKFNEDKILLAELLPEYAIVQISNPPMPVWDEMTLGFSEFIQTKKPSLWLSFAAQLLLDSIHATRYTRMRPFDDLRMTALRIGRTIDDHRKLSATHPRPVFWPKEGDELIDSIRSDITGFIEKDAFLMAKTAMSSALGKPNCSTDHLLFIRNPTLCGIFAFHFQLHMQTVGQSLVTQWFDVQQLAVLYGLVQSVPSFEGLSWPDMELFIKIHGEDHIFMGSRARNAEQALARLEMVTGISSATRFASDSRRVQSDFHTPDGKPGRRLTPTTNTANLLRPYYAPDYKGTTARHSIDGTSLSKYLNEIFETTSSGKNKSGQVEVSKARTQQLLGSKWRNQRNVGFVQLLALMKAQLYEEEPYLQFNYLAMHRRSIELLRLIREKEHPKFVQYFTDRYLPDESFIPNIVILILHVARGSAMASQQLGFAKSTGGMTGSRIIVNCADVMKNYLEKNGESVLKELRTFCKNKAPLDLHDSRNPEDTASSQHGLYWTCIDEILSPAEMESLRTGISLA